MGVKRSTSDIIVYGETGCYPISLTILANVFAYYHRLLNMRNHILVKKVFNSLTNLSNSGFSTWVSEVIALASSYNIALDSEESNKIFKQKCRTSLEMKFRENWQLQVTDIQNNPYASTHVLTLA